MSDDPRPAPAGGPSAAPADPSPASPEAHLPGRSASVGDPGFVDAYRGLAAEISRSVAVLTCLRAGKPQAITVDSFLDVSWDPPTMAVSVYSGSRMMEALERADSWALSVLSAQQKGTAQWLGEPGQPLHGVLDPVPTFRSPGGLPIVAEAPVWFELALTQRLEVATHTLIVGEVRACGTAGARGTGRPLIRFGEGYGTFAPRAGSS